MKYALFAIGLACAFLADAQGGPNPEDFWERSTVYRDEWGVPHVYADSPLTLGFAFGYAQAEDHIAGMLRAYRIANGRAAEVWGESMAKSDEFALQMGHAELAAKAFPKLDGITIELCQGFAYGVNTWLLENPGAAPSWADAVKPEDVLALMHCYFMSQAPYDFPDRAPYPAVASTGNAWAIDATKSKDGSPMLAFAMHGAYEGAFLWYEAHLAMPGYDCEGATIYLQLSVGREPARRHGQVPSLRRRG